MKFLFTMMILTAATVYGLIYTGWYEEIKAKAEFVSNYEKSALKLASENRELNIKIDELNFKLQGLEAQNKFLTMKIEKKGLSRTVASVAPVEKADEKLVKYDVYKWTPKQLAVIGDNEYNTKNYEKSAQFLNVLISKFPKDVVVNDRILFQAGVSAYESKAHYDWTKEHLSNLVKNYPKSKYFRGAKLWLALANLKTGDKAKFYETVEEFRLKYRNTDEWEILSGYYEELNQKYK